MTILKFFQFTKADKISGNGSIAASNTGGGPTGQSSLTGGGQVVGQVQQQQQPQPQQSGMGGANIPGTGTTQQNLMAQTNSSSCNYGGEQLVSALLLFFCV